MEKTENEEEENKINSGFSKIKEFTQLNVNLIKDQWSKNIHFILCKMSCQMIIDTEQRQVNNVLSYIPKQTG